MSYEDGEQLYCESKDPHDEHTHSSWDGADVVCPGVGMVSKTTITFTVLHRTGDEGLALAGTRDYNHFLDGPLGYVLQEAWDGGMVGVESDAVTVNVPDDNVYDELTAMGNDGSFFDDDFQEASGV